MVVMISKSGSTEELVRLLLESDCIVRGPGGGWRLDAVRLAETQLPRTYDQLVLARLAVMAEMAADAAADVALGPDQLLPGMVLAQDLASPKGQVLLPGGVRLDERTITQVKNFALRAGQAPRLHIRRDSMPPAAPAPPAHVHTHTAHP